MSDYYLPKLQAEYRKKILANGFELVHYTEDDEQDGIGFAGYAYRKDGYSHSFTAALEMIDEYDNYRAVISAECAKMKEQHA